MMYRAVGLGAILVALLGAMLASCAGPATGTRPAQYVVEGGVGEGKRWQDNRRIETKPILEALQSDGVHDTSNEAIKALQDPAEALGSFPIDRRGATDWVKALELGIIEPRADLKGEGKMTTLETDILFKDTGKMPWVRFPHSKHTQWLDCSNCHPKIFIPTQGANNPSMDGILSGEHCGRCHDKVAFPLWICERCHSVPHENSPPQWWK